MSRRLEQIEEISKIVSEDFRLISKDESDSIVGLIKSMDKDDMDAYLKQLDIDIRDEKIRSIFK